MQTKDPRSIQQLAESGDVAAQVELAKLKLAQDRYEEAAFWLRRAAEKEDEEAQCLFGSLLFEGLGVDQDQEAAAYWLRLAAERGHSGAQVLLAQSFESGSGVPVSQSVAAQWYRRAAEQGDHVAQYKYGQLLHQGRGVPQDLAQACCWLVKSAEGDCLEGQTELAECLIEQGNFDINEVRRWCKAAAANGSLRARHLLGWTYENAPGDQTNIAEAQQCYRDAAEQGWAESQLRLAQLYAEGKIVSRDEAEAERWLNLAIRQAPEDAPQASAGAASLPGVAAVAPARTVQEFVPGNIIDEKYFIMSILGKGGMCKVYKAKHLKMNRMVALKMLLPEHAANEGFVQRFQREAQAASALSHPNVVTMFDLGTTSDGRPFIVMDYLDGESLDHLIAERALTAQEVVSIFTQVCAALTAAHEAGIIHRDIKPSNIMLSKGKGHDIARVVDFGLAKLLEPGESDMKLTKTGEVFGTLMYMSPEQCLGHPLDARTDIYSVGCAMYEAVSGQPLFSGATAYELMAKHINHLPRPLAETAPQTACPPALERIILKALAKNRADRHQTAEELHNELAALRL